MIAEHFLMSPRSARKIRLSRGNGKIRLSQVIRFREENPQRKLMWGETRAIFAHHISGCSALRRIRIARVSIKRIFFSEVPARRGSRVASRRVATDVLPGRLLNPSRAFPYPETRNYFGRRTCAISCTSVYRAA